MKILVAALALAVLSVIPTHAQTAPTFRATKIRTRRRICLTL